MKTMNRLAAPIAALCLLPLCASSVAVAQSATPASPVLAQATPLVAADAPPDVTMRAVAEAVLRDLDTNRATYRQDPKAMRSLVDKYLWPYFDADYSARLVLGKHWREADATQRKRFIDAFYQSLLQNYGDAVLEFTPDRLKILPYRGDPAATTATVRTEVKRSNGAVVPVNYTLRKTPTGWKAWDVTIEGISYVKSFRTDFGTEIDQKGIEAVIQRLEAQAAGSVSGRDAAQGRAAQNANQAQPAAR
jgi:phospholipid transport system substrate-binding protein